MSGTAPAAVGIDFGTSNSAVATLDVGGSARLVPLEAGATAMPTALFFNAEDGTLHFGREAVALYLAGVEGRLLRSLKSLLGSSLLEEETAVGGRLLSFRAIIARYLAELRERTAAHCGAAPVRAVLGRPVHFVDDDRERDARAEAALAECAASAGFEAVQFELEPIAAALDYEQRVEREALVLVVDIGGGTSDFTVVRLGPKRRARADRRDDILATSGVHVAGTDYDQRLNLQRVMPLLGFHHVGPHGREVPSPLFVDLASWHLIHWTYAPKRLREARALRSDYTQARLHDRLMIVLQERLGHRLLAEVEQAKIESSTSGGLATLDLGAVETGLQVQLDAAGMAHDLAGLLAQVVDCAAECVRRAGLAGRGPDAIYLTGGSSSLRPFLALLQQRFPGTPLVEGDRFGGVASGLAYAAARRFA